MSIVSARGISKGFGVKTLWREVSLTMSPGDRVGLIGLNGTGKSTLLKVLAGEDKPDDGIVERQRDQKVMYLAQEPKFDAGLTPRAIVAEGLGEWLDTKRKYDELSADLTEDGLEEHSKLAAKIEHLGGWTREHEVEDMLQKVGVLHLDGDIGKMSGGERRRVAIAALLVSRPALAILDEPTNHLDADTIEWLEAYLRDEFSGAVLMVTHDRYVLDALCNRIVELDRGSLYTYQGNYADFLELKAARTQQEERVESNRLNLLRRETEWLRRGPKARTTKQKARIQRAEALIDVKVEKAPEAIVLEGSAVRSGRTILEMEDVGMDIGDRTLFSGLTLSLTKGSRIGIIGKNGAGKTTLLRAIMGDMKPTRGTLKLGQNTRIAYFDQARANLRDDWSVFDNVAEREGAITTGGISVEIGEESIPLRTYLERFMFDPQSQRQQVGALSGGERARVALAKILKSRANLLLLDEPTNDLDTLVLGALEDMLETWPGCALMVSHDRYFLNRLATDLLVFDGENVTHYAGNYETYRSLRPEQLREAAKIEKKEAAARKKATLSYNEQRELETMMEKIAAAEVAVAAAEKELEDPDLYVKRHAEVKGLQTALAEKKAALDGLVARWELLEQKKGA